MERWKVSDAEALDLIAFPGKPGKSGNRPRFRFITKQARLVSHLLEVDGALAAVGSQRSLVAPASPSRAVFGTLSGVLHDRGGRNLPSPRSFRHLTHAGLQASLRAAADETAE
jgi:hypothetical protein